MGLVLDSPLMFHGPEHLPKVSLHLSSSLPFIPSSLRHCFTFLKRLGFCPSFLPIFLLSPFLSSILAFIVLCLSAVLGIKPRVLSELGKQSTTMLYSQLPPHTPLRFSYFVFECSANMSACAPHACLVFAEVKKES